MRQLRAGSNVAKEALHGGRQIPEAGGVARAERRAHTIKAASGSVGGQALRKVAFEMEKAGKTGDLKAVMACLPELEVQFARLKASMSEFLNHT